MNDVLTSLPVSAADIEQAAKVLASHAVRTPLLSSPVIDALSGARVLLKPEMLQRTGSFKFRGAFNKLMSIPEEARPRGVVAFSSGNHAQGVADAAQLLGVRATIVMPADAPASKRERTKAYGAELVLYDRLREDREAIARRIAEERGATLVPPYDDTMIIAGQGTVGREIVDDLEQIGLSPDLVMAPASGGGLCAGIAVAVRSRCPQASIVCAEPDGFDDHARSLRAGQREPHQSDSHTICDALMAPIPGQLTFSINQRLLARGVSVSDAEVAATVGLVFREMRLVVEPSGAVALAALLTGRIQARGKTVAVVLSGGNVDPDMYARLIEDDTMAPLVGAGAAQEKNASFSA